VKKHFSASISKKQSSDSGMALVLILLLLSFITKNTLFYKLAIPALLINMIVPWFYYPFAFIWLGFSNLVGAYLSKLVLGIIYIILVIPVGVIRRLAGKDSLQMNEFKKGAGSVFKVRNYKFSSKDLENPF
jgi:hypothetical protein